MQFPLVVGNWSREHCVGARETSISVSRQDPVTVPFLSVQGVVACSTPTDHPASIFTLQEDEHHGHSRCHHRIRHLHPPRYVYSNSVGCPTYSLFPTHSTAERIL